MNGWMEWMADAPWTQMGVWHWWGVAVVLIIVEVLFVPAFFCLWLGVSALLVGLWLIFVPGLDWRMQWFGFSFLAMVSLLVWQLWLRPRWQRLPESGLNQRGHHYLGREVTLESPIHHGCGRVRLDDTSWKIFGPDLPSGVRVRITGIDGIALLVEPVVGSADQSNKSDVLSIS
ncbi:MAG: NfeD family protein [Magnetococcales bacterium]|nr:NfeD family protein [Magnetococcales bacterium]NGZ06987.1 NfeD family protein [Magnetococcales bacterium]